MKKIIILSNTTYGIDMFLLKTLQALKEQYDITIITNADIHHYSKFNIPLYRLPLIRKPSIFKDFYNLIRIVAILRAIKPDLLITLTPKSGFLGSIAGRIASVKTSHFFTGQVWKNKTGIKRFFLKTLDTIIIKFNFLNYCDSLSQKEFLEKELYSKEINLRVIGNGSLGGVDVEKFNIENRVKNETKTLNLLYLARKTEEKGANDVLLIFKTLYSLNKNFRLYFIGPEEEKIKYKDVERLESAGKLININAHVNPSKYLKITDILLTPSKREGFCSIVIQAAAMGIPAIGYDIYGLQDSISKENGVRVPLNDITAFVNAILEMKIKLDKEESIVRRDCRNYALKFDEKIFISSFLKELSEII